MHYQKHTNPSNQLRQIALKLNSLYEITYSIKCQAYQLANLPIETVKLKFCTSQSSILTSIDSIYHDLKRVQSILSQQSKVREVVNNRQMIKNNGNTNSYGQLAAFSRMSYTRQWQGQVQGLQRKLSQLSFYKSGKKTDLKKTRKINNIPHTQQAVFTKSLQQPKFNDPPINLITFNDQSFRPRPQSNYSQIDQIDQFNSNELSYETLSNKQPRNRKQSHDVGCLTKVSSVEYVGMRQTPSIRVTLQDNSAFKSNNALTPQLESYQSKSPIDMKEIEDEQYEKDKDNEEFIRRIQRNRENLIRSISKKKQKCLHTLQKVIANQDQTRSRASQKSISKKFKSKTQVFQKQDII